MTDKHTLVERILEHCLTGIRQPYERTAQGGRILLPPPDVQAECHCGVVLKGTDEHEVRWQWAEHVSEATRITALEAREAELVERLSNAAEELEYFVEFARRQSEFEGDAEAGFAVVREARATLAKHQEGEG